MKNVTSQGLVLAENKWLVAYESCLCCFLFRETIPMAMMIMMAYPTNKFTTFILSICYLDVVSKKRPFGTSVSIYLCLAALAWLHLVFWGYLALLFFFLLLHTKVL